MFLRFMHDDYAFCRVPGTVNISLGKLEHPTEDKAHANKNTPARYGKMTHLNGKKICHVDW